MTRPSCNCKIERKGRQTPYYKRMAGERTIKVIVLSGKKEDFTDYWEDKFLARASCQVFQELLTGCKPEELLKDSTILDATQAD